jgi:hypothetical protein
MSFFDILSLYSIIVDVDTYKISNVSIHVN